MMMFGGFLLVILAVVVVALLVRGGSTAGRAFWPGGDQEGKQRSALQLLEERFASGEIDREEFERRREILSQSQR